MLLLYEGRVGLITGTIPPQIGDLDGLQLLYLVGHDELTGSIPPELGNLRSLTSLTLLNNDLTGMVPAELGNLVDLEVLNLYGNRLNGTIPESFLGLTRLCYFSYGNNCNRGCLCMPNTAEFRKWREALDSKVDDGDAVAGPYCS